MYLKASFLISFSDFMEGFNKPRFQASIPSISQIIIKIKIKVLSFLY